MKMNQGLKKFAVIASFQSWSSRNKAAHRTTAQIRKMANEKEEDNENILVIPVESKKAQKQQTTEEEEKSAVRYFIREVKKMCDVMTCDEKLQSY